MAKVRVVASNTRSPREIEEPSDDEKKQKLALVDASFINKCDDVHRVLSSSGLARGESARVNLTDFSDIEKSVVEIAKGAPLTQLGKEKKVEAVDSYIAFRGDSRDALVKIVRALCEASLSP